MRLQVSNGTGAAIIWTSREWSETKGESISNTTKLASIPYTTFHRKLDQDSAYGFTMGAVSSFLDSLLGFFFRVRPLGLLVRQWSFRGRSRPELVCDTPGWNAVVGGYRTLRYSRPRPCAPAAGSQRPAGGTFRFSGWRKTSRPRRYPSTPVRPIDWIMPASAQ